jgi:hypothetical protein
VKRAVLFGVGADIGSNLLGQNDVERDGFMITDVVTRHIASDKALEPTSSLQQLAGRILLADPGLIGQISTDEERSTLVVKGRTVRVHFHEVESDEIFELGHFDLAILATHREHIRSAQMLARIGRVADRVIGVAENTALPGFYTPLDGANLGTIGIREPVRTDSGHFSLGSCQCVGWAAQLRGVIEAAELAGIDDLGLVRTETEIIHPDTASSRFGTQGIGARREDARDNLRPGFSQLQASMTRIPNITARNTVSLRVLTQPPGYQVSRFFVRARLDAETVRAGFVRAAAAMPNVIQTTDLPIGSRAFSQSPAAATIITAGTHLTVTRDAFPGSGITEIITQAYVHNTTGYCNSVLEAGRRLLADADRVTLLPSVEEKP